MKKTSKRDSERFSKRGIDRRTFLKLAAATAGPLVMQGFPPGNLFAAEPSIELEDPSYEKMYNNREGFYMKDAKWVKQTLSRLQWPKTGERVPEFKAIMQKERPFILDSMRKVAADAQQIGLKYNVELVSTSKWLEDIMYHNHGDVEVHATVARVERVDPSDWLSTRGYGLEQRNYGEWVNKEYDQLIRLQAAESDPKKRLEYVQQAQKILAEDYFITQFGWGPATIEAYNAQQRVWGGQRRPVLELSRCATEDITQTLECGADCIDEDDQHPRCGRPGACPASNGLRQAGVPRQEPQCGPVGA
jgi:peptide/nickel transport system substrate-binding protein